MTEQPLVVNLKVKFNLSKCIHTDSIQDTIDYVELSQLCIDTARNHHYHLIESYASQVMQQIFEKYPVQWVWIKVLKPKAIPHAGGALVELEEGDL